MQHPLSLLRVCLLSYVCLLTIQLPAQSVRKVTGTGQTTGHIAVLTVENKTGNALHVVPQSFYIPSAGQYQPYVGSIPEGIIIPPENTITITVNGYCADVSKPPVPPGESMPPIETWIPVGPIPAPGISQGTPFITLPKPPVSPFTPEMVPVITTSTGFKAFPPDPEKPGTTITWPGTDLPISGVFTPEVKPEVIAPVLVEVIDRLTRSFEKMKEEKPSLTPFSPDPQREREAVIQQTFWIYTSALAGKPYEKPDFEAKVIEQFTTTTGLDTASLPEEQQIELQAGIVQFWTTFQATGVEAKVLSVLPESTPTMPEDLKDPNDAPAPEQPELISETYCGCGDISFNAELQVLGVLVKESENLMFTTGQIRGPGINRAQPQTILETKMMVAEESGITIVMKDLKTSCTECKPGSPCAPTQVDVTALYGEVDENNRSNNPKASPVTSNNGVFTLKGIMPKGERDVVFFIMVAYACTGTGCKPDTCKQQFALKVKRKGLCTCEHTDVTLKYDLKKPGQKSISYPFTFIEKEVVASHRLGKNDQLSIALEAINATCQGCDPKCAPEKIEYRVYGENIAGLATEANNKSEKYEGKAKLVSDKKLTGPGGDAVLYIHVEYQCSHKTCMSDICNKTYSLRFKRE